MGVASSKPRPRPKQAMPVQPINMPPQPPYNGYPIVYQHIIIQATIDMHARLSFLTPDISLSCTNVEQYYPQLAAMYQQGYKMLVFVALPGSTKSFGGFSAQSQSMVKFQGIFRRLFPEEMQQQWELKVEKSTLVNQMFHSWSGSLLLSSREMGSNTDSSHIFQTINNITQLGGRLISVEISGMAGQQLEIQRQMMQQNHHAQRMMWNTGTMPAMQVTVDVFYEVPRNPTGEQYVYQIINCPMQSTFVQQGLRPTYQSVIAWEQLLTQYLGTGWKLVEIFEDFSVNTMMQGGFSANHTQIKNCLWIFEKPASRMNDNTPLYEGTMVEHWFQTSTQVHGMGFGGVEVNVTTDWEPVLEHFGKSGWQVVRILETPDIQMQGMFQPTIRTRQMIFLQRLKEGVSEYMGATGSGVPPQGVVPTQPFPTEAPPEYNQLYGEKQ